MPDLSDPTVMGYGQLSAQQRSSRYRRLRGAGILVVSVLAHSLLLTLPLPQSAPVTEEPEPEIIDLLASPPMDVVTLPESNLELPEQDATPDTAAKDTTTPAPRPTPRSAPPSPPAANTAPPPRTAAPDPRPAPDTTENSENSENSDPPPEATAGDSPPSLEQRLLNAGEYVVDAGAKTGNSTDFFARLPDIESWQESAANDLIDETQPAVDAIRFDIPYQLRCQRSLPIPPEPGLLAVIIDTNGDVVRGVDVIYSSKYPVLDQQAISAATTNYVPQLEKPVSDTGTGEIFQYRMHLIVFEVDTSNDGC